MPAYWFKIATNVAPNVPNQIVPPDVNIDVLYTIFPNNDLSTSNVIVAGNPSMFNTYNDKNGQPTTGFVGYLLGDRFKLLYEDSYHITQSVSDYFVAGTRPTPTTLNGPDIKVTINDPRYPTSSSVYNSYWWTEVEVPDIIYSTGDDTVDFNSLSPVRITAVNSTILIYNSLGGNDKIILPDINTISNIPKLGDLLKHNFVTGKGNSVITAGNAKYGIEGIAATGGPSGEIGNKTIDGTRGDVTILFHSAPTSYRISYIQTNLVTNGHFNVLISNKDASSSDTLTRVSKIEFNSSDNFLSIYDASAFEALAVTKFVFDGFALMITGFGILATGPEAALALPAITAMMNSVYAGIEAGTLHSNVNKAFFQTNISTIVDFLLDQGVEAIVGNNPVSQAIVKKSVQTILEPSLSYIKEKSGELFDSLFKTETAPLAPKGDALKQDLMPKIENGLTNLFSIGQKSVASNELNIATLHPTDALVSIALPTLPTSPSQVPYILPGKSSEFLVADNNGALSVSDTVINQSGTLSVANYDVFKFTDGTGFFDPTGSAEDVSRIYGATLGRASDVAGLEYWACQIDGNNVSLSAIASNFVTSPEFIQKYGSLSNDAFVNQLYQNVLGRPADTAGAQFWDGTLASGASRGTVVLGFAESQENQANTISTAGDANTSEAYRLYQAALHRTPDAGGLSFWTSTLNNGATPNQVAQQFINSSEFQNDYGALSINDFVTTLYNNVLHRAPDAGGQQFWTSQLQHGASESSVLIGFSDSVENRLQTASATHANWVFIPA